MPFQSQSQRRFMYWAEQQGKVPKGTVKEWDEHTSKKKLPEKVKTKKSDEFHEDFMLSRDKELKTGKKIELEHSDTIKQIQKDAKEGKIKSLNEYTKNIAKDHLSEIKDYYTRLVQMEEEAKKDIKKGGPGSGRHKELLAEAESQYIRLDKIGDGGTIHKRKNIQTKLRGISELLKEDPNDDRNVKNLCDAITEAKMHKSLDDKINSFNKAPIPHKDTMSFTDSTDMLLSKLVTPENYQTYVQSYVNKLEPGVAVSIPLKNNNVLKIYKVENGIYSGSILAEDGTITHNIDKVTIPEIVSHLVATENNIPEEENEKIEEKPTVKVEKEVELKDKNIVINININKSKEHEMDTLDSKIEAFCKSEKPLNIDNPKDKIEDKKDLIEDKEPEKKDEDENKKKEEGKHQLVSEMIDTAKKHHEQGNKDNVKDLSKFLVHLHKDDSKEIKKSFDDTIVGYLKKEPVKEIKKQDKDRVKKSDESNNDLVKAEEIKRTKEENKQIFDHMLKDMIKWEYKCIKRRCPNLEEEKLMKKLKEIVNANIVRQMMYDDKLLLAKRSVNYDDKYYNDMIKTIDFKEIDSLIANEKQSPELMYYSMEGRKIFAETKNQTEINLGKMEKSFNGVTKSQNPMTYKLIEKYDYQEILKGKIEKKTDKKSKEAIDSNFRK